MLRCQPWWVIEGDSTALEKPIAFTGLTLADRAEAVSFNPPPAIAERRFAYFGKSRA